MIAESPNLDIQLLRSSFVPDLEAETTNASSTTTKANCEAKYLQKQTATRLWGCKTDSAESFPCEREARGASRKSLVKGL